LRDSSLAILSTKPATKGITAFGISLNETDYWNYLQVPDVISHADISIKSSGLLALNQAEKHRI
jgi:hypothetical protein